MSSQRNSILVLLTAVALTAFAANSVLARLALIQDNIDPISFTIIRLLFGALMLGLLVFIRSSLSKHSESSITRLSIGNLAGNTVSSLLLFIYAITFSIACLLLDAAIGALTLFGAVQITIILIMICTKHKLSLLEYLGTALAFAGFVYLILPNLSSPSLTGFILMAISGVAWAGYTLRGKGSKDPLSETAGNFIRTLPYLVILCIYLGWGYLFPLDVSKPNMGYSASLHINQTGLYLAMISGAITSGMGYALWYWVLRGLTSTQAGVVQLLVPLIAALGGIVFIDEPITSAFFISSIMILGGILLTIVAHRKH